MALEREIATFEKMREELERVHMGKFVVIRGDELFGAFDTFANAAAAALAKFDSEDFLIRQVGAGKVKLPVSVIRGIRRRADTEDRISG